MVTTAAAGHHGCSTVSLSSASDEVTDHHQSSDDWDYLDASFAGDQEQSLYPPLPDDIQDNHYVYYDGGDLDDNDDDDTVDILDTLEPTTSPTLITSAEVETEYYNFLRDE